MPKNILFFLFISLSMQSLVIHAQNYKEYYQLTNKADSTYYILKDYKNGLAMYKSIMDKFDFVWIEDCIRGVQLSLLHNDEKGAICFIKRAIDNGFELGLVKYLNMGCQCTFFKDMDQPNTLLNDFISRNRVVLENYYKKVRPNYLSKLDTALIKKIYTLHTIDEIYKTRFVEDETDAKEHWKVYEKLLKKNYQTLVGYFDNGIFIGEKNIGRYTNQLVKDLGIPHYNADVLCKNYCNNFMVEYQINGSTPPVCTESDYFQSNAYFVSLHHISSKREIEFETVVLKNFDKLVNGGFIHPRELLHIRFKSDPNQKACLWPSMYKNSKDINVKDVNEVRKSYYLPSFELDKLKHDYAHEHNIQLFFGFLQASR